MAEPRKRRANGEASRQRILDAAAEIAGERGYEGTSIDLVSERSGLPASSIYWHFTDKDALIAAVIERSYEEWLERVSALGTGVVRRLAPRPDGRHDGAHGSHAQRVRGLPPVGADAGARAATRGALRPAEVRADPRGRPSAARSAPTHASSRELDDAAVHQLATFTMAMADGLFVAQEIGGDSVDILEQFEPSPPPSSAPPTTSRPPLARAVTPAPRRGRRGCRRGW